MYRNLDEVIAAAKNLPSRQRLAVAAAQDQDVLEAVRDAVEWGVVSAILVGDQVKIREIAQAVQLDLGKCQVVPEANPVLAARKAVAMVAAGEADLVMKGKVGTADISGSPG